MWMHRLAGDFDDQYETNINEGHIKNHSNIKYNLKRKTTFSINYIIVQIKFI